MRIKAQPELYQSIARFTPALTTAEILARCHAVQIPAQAVRDLGEVMDDPHLTAVDFFRRREHPVEGVYFEQAAPVKFAVSADGKPNLPPPLIDQDGKAVRTHGWQAFDLPKDG